MSCAQATIPREHNTLSGWASSRSDVTCPLASTNTTDNPSCPSRAWEDDGYMFRWCNYNRA
ncbi:proline-rich receptor-like protein kinase PERK2 [Iris pallida]|uniref:Proline-rich receptor-like protein kinase PERK2 n=1 Tax=Iris pallida TaxID=29817 RepID=A0AAX6DK17_IRIPA|nr:proline-rich receptor-like protein kinase PERK2 [Iris pallida]